MDVNPARLKCCLAPKSPTGIHKKLASWEPSVSVARPEMFRSAGWKTWLDFEQKCGGYEETKKTPSCGIELVYAQNRRERHDMTLSIMVDLLPIYVHLNGEMTINHEKLG